MDTIDTDKFIKEDDSQDMPLVIRTLILDFSDEKGENKERGIIVTDGVHSTYVYPLYESPSDPLGFLREALLQSRNQVFFLEMMKQAYLDHQDITIDGKLVGLDIYSELFRGSYFYVPQITAEVIPIAG